MNQRTRELGIRMALGCTLQGAMFEVSRSGIAATGAGLACGLFLSSAAVKVLRSQLFGVALYDPLTLCAVSALLALVAVLAAVLPTFRIAKIDPAETLRCCSDWRNPSLCAQGFHRIDRSSPLRRNDAGDECAESQCCDRRRRVPAGPSS